MPKGPREHARAAVRARPHPEGLSPAGGAPATRLPGWLLPAIALLLAVVVHRRALGAFFSTDDLVRLEEAAGLRSASATLWRLVSEVLYVKLMLGVFGLRPLPFHVVSLALHLVNAGFVFRLGRKAGLSAAASCFAASVFGAFPLFHTVLLSAVNINDIMALTFTFVALWVIERPSPARSAAAIACFALALLSKEAVLLAPFAFLLLPQPGEGLAGAARRLAPLLVAGIAFGGFYLAFRTHGLGTGGYAYAAGVGMHVFHNLMTYAYWSVDLARPVPDAQGTFDPAAWRAGVWPLAALALSATLPGAPRRAIAFGCAWWLVGLAPVLPLMAHTYGHYLYVPMAGLAIAAAAAIEALAAGVASLAHARRGPREQAPPEAPRPARDGAPRLSTGAVSRRIVAAAFVVLAAGYALRAELLIRERVSARLGNTQFALDPFTRKMEVAARAIATLGGQLDRDRASDSVVVFTPPGLGRAISARTGQVIEAPSATAPQYNVVEAVLDGGLAIRLFEPHVDSVVFVSRWTPAYRNFTLFAEGPEGRMMKMGRGSRAHARFAGAMLTGGFTTQARDYLSEVVPAYPEDRLVRLLYAAALSNTGEHDSARAHARLVIEGAAEDTLTVTARQLLAVIDEKK